MIKTGSDFSGIGAFDQALLRLGIPYKTVFACDMDKFARQAYIANYGEPDYYPKNVYDRDIPEEPLDIFMTSPPCQAFSLAGKRKGEDDKRGVLFYNSHEFIQKNNPRYFIFENVKGLLSDDSGKTFKRWLDFLGGKSINGNPVIFPHEESVPYHIYWKVLNAKHYGVPQNRERVFIVGIRDDSDNHFNWPKPFPLTKKLKDVLEENVDEKYFLSDKYLDTIINHSDRHQEKGNGFKFEVKKPDSVANSITTKAGQRTTDNYIKIKSATSKGYETATENNSINFSQPNSEIRRGRVGKEVAQTLDTACNQGIIVNPLKDQTQYGWHFEQNVYSEDSCTRALKSSEGSGNKPKVISNYQIRRLTPRECLRLMDFPDTFKIVCSDSQTYKQAGNSIVVAVLASIIEKLNL